METHQAYLVLGLLLVLGSSVMARSSRDEIECNSRTPLDRSSFPEGFIFGAATSAYQVEGAESEGGPSTWHQFTRIPGQIKDGSNGDVADDSYHRYKEDIRILKEMGLDAYRFSISWSRILPNGKFSGGVNEEGIKYYNNLIDELLANGIKPFVTLLHFDVPQALEDEYGGFLSSRIVNDFYNYVDLCFGKFGDRVKHWVTLNEPWSFSYGGYAMGFLAPGRCSSWQQLSCTGGDSATEPYLVAHYQLLAHAAAVKLYRSKYERRQMGKIGITLISEWFEPYSSTREDYEAALRGLDFMFGWFMDPLTTGDYPQIMRSLVGSRLPTFSKEQSNLLIESFDFLGLNYYSAVYAANAPNSFTLIPSYITDSRVNQLCERDGVPIGPQTSSPWLHVYPSGIRDLLLYIKEKYNDPLIYITENGVSEVNNSTLTLLDALDDKMRIAYHRDHLCFLRQAIEGGVKVGGYFIWSLLDNFEWSDGYSVRFGINYVDYKNGLKRYPKHSALWFTGFLRKQNQNSQPTISDH